MNATCGLFSSGSSASADLIRCLASKLRARLPLPGGIEYRMTWKVRVTDAGRLIYRLAASGRLISGRDFSGWPSPRVADTQNESIATKRKRNARHLATSLSTSRTKGVGGLTLPMTATLAGWPTPKAGEDNRNEEQYQKANAKIGKHAITSLNVLVRSQLAGWPTPNAMEGGATSRSGERKGELLMGGLVRGLAGWGTPRATDGSNGGPNQDDQSALPPQVSGLTASPSSAETGSLGGYRLNPYFSAWLIGLPPAWVTCCLNAVSRSRSKSKAGRPC